MVRAASGTFLAGKPCSFNAIGGVTGTHHAFPSRTKEQGVLQRKKRLPSKRRALPGVECLLE
jgi:hypothetical protein